MSSSFHECSLFFLKSNRSNVKSVSWKIIEISRESFKNVREAIQVLRKCMSGNMKMFPDQCPPQKWFYSYPGPGLAVVCMIPVIHCLTWAPRFLGASHWRLVLTLFLLFSHLFLCFWLTFFACVCAAQGKLQITTGNSDFQFLPLFPS